MRGHYTIIQILLQSNKININQKDDEVHIYI